MVQEFALTAEGMMELPGFDWCCIQLGTPGVISIAEVCERECLSERVCVLKCELVSVWVREREGEGGTV